MKVDPWEGRKRGRACKYIGTDNTLDVIRMGNFVDICMNWFSMKPKVVNLSHSIRYLMEWGEGKQIMVTKAEGTRKLKEPYCRWEDHRSINSVTLDHEDPSKVTIMILSFPRNSLCVVTMLGYWRVRNRQMRNSRGDSHSEATPSSRNDFLPTIDEEHVPWPFSWGDQYMAKTPMVIEAFIAIK